MEVKEAEISLKEARVAEEAKATENDLKEAKEDQLKMESEEAKERLKEIKEASAQPPSNLEVKLTHGFKILKLFNMMPPFPMTMTTTFLYF